MFLFVIMLMMDLLILTTIVFIFTVSVYCNYVNTVLHFLTVTTGGQWTLRILKTLINFSKYQGTRAPGWNGAPPPMLYQISLTRSMINTCESGPVSKSSFANAPVQNYLSCEWLIRTILLNQIFEIKITKSVLIIGHLVHYYV